MSWPFVGLGHISRWKALGVAEDGRDTDAAEIRPGSPAPGDGGEPTLRAGQVIGGALSPAPEN